VSGQSNARLLAEASDRDAPPEGGSFDGGYVASATQGARYGRHRRETEGPIDPIDPPAPSGPHPTPPGPGPSPAGGASHTPSPADGSSQRVVLGKDGEPQRVVDIGEIEALVNEVIDLRDPAVIAAAKAINPDDPDAVIRDAILVFYRNGRQFDTVGALADATTARLDTTQRVGDVDWDADVKDIAATHPERGPFFDALDGLVDPARIESLWSLVVAGVHFQKQLNDAGAVQGGENPHYRKLADELEALLAVAPGDMPALWSGGYDVSMYAQQRGYRTLEVTAAGKIFDQLKLASDFDMVGWMWDAISRKFVASFGGEIHVFVRTMDKNSTLFQQELAELGQHDDVVDIRWHVMQGRDLSTLTEIDADGNPAPGHTVDGFRAAAAAMSPSSIRAPEGDKAIPGEPDTADGVHARMVAEQQDMPRYVAQLHAFAGDQAAALGVGGPEHRTEIEQLTHAAELTLKNDPALGVELADLYAEVEDGLAKRIAHLARTLAAGPAEER